MMKRRRFTAAMLAAPIWPSWSLAQSGPYPNRPVKLVVPFPPGSAGDLVSRMLASKLQAGLGQPVVLEHKPGAAGNIAAEFVARAPADGYTLLSATSAIVITPWLQKAPIDPAIDLLPLSQTIAGSYVLLVNPSFPARTFPEFLEVARKNPGKFSYASYGNGSGTHLAMELLKVRAGLFITHVPYRGAAPAMHDLIGGRVEMAFDTTLTAIPQIRAGKVRAIALGGPTTYDVLPGVPTIAQTFAGFDTDGWQGIFAPVGTPQDIARRLCQEIAKAMQSPDVTTRLNELGFQSIGGTQQSFTVLVAAEHARYGQLIRERGIRPD
ncbi:MAG TPA: tripartite tricarboxylate transporter substrate binding protein [Burkholderiaceae bacterium]|nr:tripartite tricarboxylate transporter substrate binding protein [Burkholderiaceae bacterium]